MLHINENHGRANQKEEGDAVGAAVLKQMSELLLLKLPIISDSDLAAPAGQGVAIAVPGLVPVEIAATMRFAHVELHSNELHRVVECLG